MRYNNTERLGINATDSVFTKEINWIFREQPVADFGVDAIVEENIENNPTGRLMGIQIKSGQGNFHISDRSLTYYISNIHYYYWKGYVLPIILVAYLPNEDQLLWQEISDLTLKKTTTKWKILIPKNKVLDKKSINELTKLLDSKFRHLTKPKSFQGDPVTIDIFELVENVSLINEAKKSTLRFIETMYDMKKSSNNLNSKIKEYVSQGLSDSDPQVLASMNKFSFELTNSAKRIKNESLIFSESFGLGISAYIQVSTLYHSLTNDIDLINETTETLSNLLVQLKNAISGVKIMRTSISKLPKKYTRLKSARSLLVESVDILIEEYEVAEQLIKKFIA